MKNPVNLYFCINFVFSDSKKLLSYTEIRQFHDFIETSSRHIATFILNFEISTPNSHSAILKTIKRNPLVPRYHKNGRKFWSCQSVLIKKSRFHFIVSHEKLLRLGEISWFYWNFESPYCNFHFEFWNIDAKFAFGYS